MHILTRLWRTFCHGRESSLQTPITASLDEMIFEDRNRAYGAYQLRKNYHWHLLVALGLTVSGPLTILLGFLWWQEFSQEPKTELVRAEVFICGGIPLPPPPPVQPRTIKCPTRTWHADLPRPIPPRPIGCTLYDKPIAPLPPSLPQDWIIPEIEAEADRIDFLPVDFCNSPHVIDPHIWLETRAEPRPLNLQALSQTVAYPPLLRDACIAGYVVARILVDDQGNYVKHFFIASPHPLLSEAIEPIIPLIQFEPAIGVEGGPICYWVNIPFNFSLGR